MAQGNTRIAPEKRSALPAGTLLRRRYEIQRVLSERESGITYRALDQACRRAVDIVEYYPAGLCARAEDGTALFPRDKRCGERFFAGSEAFYGQYAALTQAAGSRNLLPVYDAFFENGTVYAAVACAEGATLRAYLAAEGRTLTDGEFAFLLSAMADALLVIHSLSIRHGGVTAESILLTADGGALLTDYGAADALLGGARGDDIGMLGRALYGAYTGAPFDGRPRFPEGGSEEVRAVLERMLSDDPAMRFSGVFDLLHAAAGLDVPQEAPGVDMRSVRRLRRARAETPVRAADEPAAAMAEDTAAAATDGGKHAPRWLLPAIGAVLLLLLAALLAVLFLR